MTYVIPLHQNPNADGGPIGWLNCGPTSTAMQVAFETNGAKRPSGGDVRARCLEPNGQRDITGGTTPSQNVDAAKRGWDVDLDYALMTFDRAWTLSSKPDWMLHFLIVYAPVSGTKFDGSPGFTGRHSLVRTNGLVLDPLADGRRPGIPSSPQAWPKDLLRRASGLYSGDGMAAVLVARAPAIRPDFWSALFDPGTFFVYPRPGMVRRREAFSKRTSAPCTAPFPIPWPGGAKRVVEILDGRLKGLCVEPDTTHITLKEHRA